MDRDINSVIDSFYYIKYDKERKKNGIYCQQIDRWVMIDDYDVWITLKTAQVLSSKIATTVYIMPEHLKGMNNKNCMNYTILNKTIFTRRNTPDLIMNQTPTLKKLGTGNIIKMGVPNDYDNEEGKSKLDMLKEFIDYVNKVVYAIEYNSTKNWIDNETVSSAFHPGAWSESMSTYVDKSHYEKGIHNEMLSSLYFADSVQEARKGIFSIISLAMENRIMNTNEVDTFCRMAEGKPYLELLS